MKAFKVEVSSTGEVFAVRVMPVASPAGTRRLTPSEARALAQELLSAADEVEIKNAHRS